MPAELTPDRFVAIVKIIREWGLQGAMKTLPYSSSFRAFLDSLRPPVSAWISRSDGSHLQKTIDSIRKHGQFFIISFDDVHDCDSARAFRGSDIKCAREALPPLGEDVYYRDQIIGLAVKTTGGHSLGSVVDILETGSNDVYVVSDGKREYLIPAIRDVIGTIDVPGKLITIKPMEGLLDENPPVT